MRADPGTASLEYLPPGFFWGIALSIKGLAAVGKQRAAPAPFEQQRGGLSTACRYVAVCTDLASHKRRDQVLPQQLKIRSAHLRRRLMAV